MNDFPIVFHASWLVITLGVLALLAMAWMCIVACRRNPKKLTFLLEGIRWLVTAAIVFLLCQPEWRSIAIPDDKPAVAVFWDDSRSMTTQDVKTGATAIGRDAAVADALKLPGWKTLESANNLIIQPFATPPNKETNPSAIEGTNITDAITKVLESNSNIRSVVLLSDGDHNLGEAPIVAAQKLRAKHVPLYTVPIGADRRLPDVSLINVKAPAYGIIGENVQIPFTIRGTLGHEVNTVVKLSNGKGKEKTRNVRIPAYGEVTDTILWRVENEGSQKLELSVPAQPGELVATNNSQAFSLAGRREQIRVLVIDSLPRWEYRFIRNALYRDPGVEVNTLLLHPGMDVGGGPGYLKEFPEEEKDLAKFDVIFIGDVGIGDGGLTPKQAELIKGLVENQASGVVFLPGVRGNQVTLANSALGDLLPVITDDKNKEGIVDEIPSTLTLTTEGRGSLLTLLADNEEDNAAVWKSLPGFNWHAPVLKAKAGTEVLAVHANRKNQFGRIPLLVTKQAGSGKVLYMGTDSAWRWRRGVEDLYHYRFWGQVARWMSYQRNMAAGERLRMYANPERPQLGDIVTLSVNATDATGVPLKDGKVFVDITSPDGKSRRVEMTKREGAWGAYSGSVTIDQPGAWNFAAVIAGVEDKPVKLDLVTQGEEIELVGQPARPDILEEMSQIARGRSVDLANINSLINDIKVLPDPKPIERRTLLWSNAWVAGLLIAMLAIFWIGRKLNGTI